MLGIQHQISVHIASHHDQRKRPLSPRSLSTDDEQRQHQRQGCVWMPHCCRAEQLAAADVGHLLCCPIDPTALVKKPLLQSVLLLAASSWLHHVRLPVACIVSSISSARLPCTCHGNCNREAQQATADYSCYTASLSPTLRNPQRFRPTSRLRIARKPNAFLAASLSVALTLAHPFFYNLT